MSRCSKCGISKKKSAFGHRISKLTGIKHYRGQCKACRCSAETRKYKAQTDAQKMKARDNAYKRLYGITLEYYNALFIQQSGKCVCGKHQSELDRALVVDHNHETKVVRGLLCPGCNLAIGNAKENPETLIVLANYLRAQ